MNASRALLWLLFALLAALPACAKPQAGAAGALAIQDLTTLPQDPAYYVGLLAPERRDAPVLGPEVQQRLFEKYLENFFDPWKRGAAKTSATEAYWGLAEYGKEQGFGENKLPRDKSWLEGLAAASDQPGYPSLARKAIAARNTALRVLPTNRPFFFDFEKAGEGYPFDNFQNSAVWAGTPLFVAHATKAGDWLFVEAGYAAGWIPANDLAFVDEAFVKAYQTGKYAVARRDDTPLRDAQGRVLFDAHLGALFPVAPGGGQPLTLLAPALNAQGKAELKRCAIPQDKPEAVVLAPLPLTPMNVAAEASRMMGQPYGWGGMYENRDCSASVRDLFALFGIWLPRNSGAQAKTGRVIALKDLDPAVKERIIIEKGVPFASLLGLKGHIVLYLGAFQGRAVVFQNIWGVRTLDENKREGRLILGRTVITTLEPGKEREEVRRSGRTLLLGVHSLTLLGQ
jgi:cell wall-associated NlpC family hydrolase